MLRIRLRRSELGGILHNTGPVLIFILAQSSYLSFIPILLFATLIQSPGSKDLIHLTIFYTLRRRLKGPQGTTVAIHICSNCLGIIFYKS